jgi:putative ABC transport system ATP-binding protein
VITLSGIQKSYQKGQVQVQALAGVDLHIGEGEFVAIVGTSGSGKSTMLNILGLLDQPSSGEYSLSSKKVADVPDLEACRLRNSLIGFVFQSFHLIPERRAWQNVALPLEYSQNVKPAQRKARALAALEQVGLLDRAEHFPAELSGGQEQRVAIARALVNNPKLILADEPTGNLDAATGESILQLLESVRSSGATLVLVTHDQGVAARAKRRIELRDGRIVFDTAA